MAILPVLVELGGRHLIASSSSGIAPGMLSAVAAAIEDPSNPHAATRWPWRRGLSCAVLCNLGHVAKDPSVGRSYRGIRRRLSTGLSAGLQHPALVTVRSFLSEFVAFLAEFGSRGPNEWELSAQTWETDPTIGSRSYRASSISDRRAGTTRTCRHPGHRT